MKKTIAMSLIATICLTACSQSISTETTTVAVEDSSISQSEEVYSYDLTTKQSDPIYESLETGESQVDEEDGLDQSDEDITYSDLSDPNLQSNIADAVYDDIIAQLGSDNYVIESIDACYIPQDYIDELTYNTQENVFFGYKIKDVEEAFNGERFVFTLGPNGETTVEAFEEYDYAYEKMLKNVAIGTGVIVVVVVIAVVTDGVGAPPAICAIAAYSAKGAVSLGLSSAVIEGATSAAVSALKGDNKEELLKTTALGATEGYKSGAIIGAITGALFEAGGLAYASSGGLSMNEVAIIQQQSKYPLSVIREFQSMEEYEIFRNCGLYCEKISGAKALIRDIDLDYIDPESGLTNLERMQKGKAAIDPATGKAYQLHHIGQKEDSVLAILTEAEHKGEGNFKILHKMFESSPVDHGAGWTKQKKEFWKGVAVVLGGV